MPNKSTTTASDSRKVAKHLGAPGRVISGSKGSYRASHPGHLIVFNSSVLTGAGEQVWRGDLDVTLDEEKLTRAARAIGKVIFVLREGASSRLEGGEALARAVVCARPTEARVVVGEGYEDLLERNVDGSLIFLPAPEPSAADAAARRAMAKARHEELGLTRSIALESVFASIGPRTRGAASPLERFWAAVELASGESRGDGQVIDVSSLWLCHSDNERLRKLNGAWMRRRFPGITDYRVESELGWLFLSIGPNHFGEGEEPRGSREGVALANATIYRHGEPRGSKI